MEIFKAYDIRGVYPKDLDEDIAYSIGAAAASYFRKEEIIVGRDMRQSSDSLHVSLLEGITDMGTSVMDIGIVSSPMASFASGSLNKPCIMITASHNPARYNGFKLMGAGAMPVSADSGLKDVEALAENGAFEKSGKKGIINGIDISERYADHVLSFIDKGRIKPIKVVIDAGNGMAGKVAPMIFSRLPQIDVIPMYFDLDGSFPNHEANPLKEENIIDLKARVKEESADMGIAFDGDADRVFFVSDMQDTIPADFVTCLIAKMFLKEKKGETVLYDLRSSWIVSEIVAENGGRSEMCKVGHSFIKEHLRKSNGIFAGELSGHFYFRDNFYADSGMIAALKIIELVSAEQKKLSELLEPLKKYFASGEINSEVKDKEAKIAGLKEKYSSGKVTEIDGIRIDFDDWWFNVRASNTEPLLRLNLEARDKKLMEEKRDEILMLIRS